ncbi:MAG: EVE domain-containing protein, partial [Oscillibacter sp.]|nr:EVE domain-containing protein [Oscillibacter sp.]
MPDKEKIKDASKNDWWPMDYSPNLSVEEWVSLIKDREVFNISSLEIMKRMLDCGGQATCKQLSLKYGETANFYNSGSVALARRVARKTGCPPREAETSKWWPMLYLGKKAGRETEGTFLQKLRDELMEALKQVDLSGVRLYASAELDEENRGFWWLTANPKYWRFSDIFVGDTESYSLCNDDGNKRRIYQNFLDAKAGDLVIGYEAAPVKKITAICRIAAEQDGEEIYFEKMEGLVSPVEYQTLRDCQELEQMEFFRNPRGSLFKLTRDEYHFILDVIREENPVLPERVVDRYTKDNFLEEVYMTGADYDKLSAMLLHKKNIILQGAPGVGKTFAAKRLAWSIMGEKDENRIEFVQFHQNYSYEDFVMGYKPVE